MTKEQLVKLGLDEATADKVLAAQTEELKGFVPLSRLNEVIRERDTARAEVAVRDGQISELQKNSGNAETLKQTIEKMKADNEAADKAHKAEIHDLKVDNAVSAALTAAKAKNVKAVRALLNLDKAEIEEDGTIKGLDAQIKALQKADDSKFLFDPVKPVPTVKGAHVGESGLEDGDNPPDFGKMTYAEMCAYLEQNPDATLPQT